MKPLMAPVALTAGLILSGGVHAQIPASERVDLVARLKSKLMASDAHQHDCFGRSLAMSGKYIIAGAKGDDTMGKDSGAAYIFERKNGDYVQIAKLKADHPHNNDYFGFTVGIDSETAVVGAWQDKEKGIDAGAVYVFVRQGDKWVSQAKLMAEDASDFAHFGYAVGLRGDRIVVGARGDNRLASSAGAAYVFHREGARWVQEARLDAETPVRSGQFGWSVAIDDDRILVGALGDKIGGIESGTAYLFHRSAAGWGREKRLVPPDPKQQQRFAYSVSLQGNSAVVGAYRDDSGGFESGAAYIYENKGGSWSSGAKLVPLDASPSQYFGWSVATDGPQVVVGAWYDGDGTKDPLGSAYIFHKDGNRWVQEKKLIAKQRTAMHLFGWVVAINGSTVGVGARLDDEAADKAGAVYLYRRESPVAAISSERMEK